MTVIDRLNERFGTDFARFEPTPEHLERVNREIETDYRSRSSTEEELERIVKHDVIAFLTMVSEQVGPEGRYLHMGLTSSDILDTSLALLMQEAADLIIVNGHPTARIQDIRNVEMVFKAGVGYDPTRLIADARGLVGIR